MTTQITEKYTKCIDNKCLERHNKSFYVKDFKDDRSRTINVSEDATCFIEIKNEEEIFFLSVDNCIIVDDDIKRCDFLITNDKDIVIFVEIKEIIYTGNTRKDFRKKNKYRKEAVKQLASTINDFKNNKINFANFEVETIIAFPPFINQTNPISIPSTCSQARISQLSNLCGYSSVNEGNHIIFD